jgi:hypothetical protein
MMTDEQLTALNAILRETPAIERYGNGKVNENKRIRLSAKMVVETQEFDYNPLPAK